MFPMRLLMKPPRRQTCRWPMQGACTPVHPMPVRLLPEDVKSGLAAAVSYIENDACFYSANDDDSIVYFAQCISRTGSYLSEMAGVPEGTAMAYLIAPPLEAVTGLDAALKAADVEMNLFYGQPTETNFAGGLLTGDQAACRAACEAFRETICRIAETFGKEGETEWILIRTSNQFRK